MTVSDFKHYLFCFTFAFIANGLRCTQAEATKYSENDLHQRVQQQEEIIATLTKELKEQRYDMERMRLEFIKEHNTFTGIHGQSKKYNFGSKSYPDLRTHLAFGCDLEVLTLACTEGNTINLQSAYYGQNEVECTQDHCCLPGDFDCTESIQDNAPGDWALLNLLCQDNTICQFEHPGRSLGSCAEPYNSDYVTVQYKCEPGDGASSSAAIGFTAYSTQTRSYWNEEETVIFDGVVNNYGGYYDASNSTFTCPITGLYTFSSSLTSTVTSSISGDIVLDGTRLVSIIGERTNFIQGSNSVTTVCNQGQVVWVRIKYTQENELYSDDTRRYSTFSGFLIRDI